MRAHIRKGTGLVGLALVLAAGASLGFLPKALADQTLVVCSERPVALAPDPSVTLPPEGDTKEGVRPATLNPFPFPPADRAKFPLTVDVLAESTPGAPPGDDDRQAELPIGTVEVDLRTGEATLNGVLIGEPGQKQEGQDASACPPTAQTRPPQ